MARRFSLNHAPAEKSERLEEERADVVGLQPAGLGLLHLRADAGDVALVEDIGG